jgi:RNA polymerase sigma-54 factor
LQVQRAAFIQELRQKMSPQLFQSIRLMELPVLDLRAKIAEELERNPALELAADRTTVSLDSETVPQKEEESWFETSSDAGFLRQGGQDAADSHQRFLEGALARDETLQEHLLWNLRLVTADDAARRFGELIIQNLDENGFHKEKPEILLKGEDPALIQAALDLVRTLDPPGCATADYRESLIVQARLLPDAPEGVEAALEYLELLEKEKFEEASKILGIAAERVKEIYRRIREDLSPFPGRSYSAGEVRYVVPDVQVFSRDGSFIIKINDEEIPVLRLNPFFKKIAGVDGRRGRQTRTAQERQVREHVKENVQDARVFIRSIHQRERTLRRVSKAIVEFQRPFFASGPKYLAPLTLRDIAQELDVHETTISRAVNGKYRQCEWGIFELRH